MLALGWDGERMAGDLVLGAGGLGQDGTLRTAVLLSLFTDRRARADDPLPEPGASRRGWVGDALATVEGDRFGSRLWLLKRAKATAETARRAEDYCREALGWLVEDELAARVAVSAQWIAPGTLGARIEITLTDGGVERLDLRLLTGDAS